MIFFFRISLLRMSNIFYVYLLLNPLKGDLPFYVGKGKGDRCYIHLSETAENTVNRFKFNTIQKIRQAGLEPKIVILLSGLSEQEAYEREKELICLLGRTGIDQEGILTNRCIYRAPPSRKGTKTAPRTLSEKTKSKISNSHLGKTHSNESRSKMSLAKLGKPGNFSGKRHSTEARLKMSLAKKGKSHLNALSHAKRNERNKKISASRLFIFEVNDGDQIYVTNNLRKFSEQFGLSYKPLVYTSKNDKKHLGRWSCRKLSEAGSDFDRKQFVDSHIIVWFE